MSDRPPIPFRAVIVHKTASGAQRVAPPARGRMSFAEMLRRAGPTADSRPPRSSVLPTRADDFDNLPEGRVCPIEDEPRDDDGLGGELLPSPEALEALLAQAAPVESARDSPAGPLAAIAQLAATIAGFCNERAVQDSEGWSVHIDLRADVVPDTSLDLTVSAHWLQLRFQTGQPASRRLLCEHEKALRRQLDADLERSRDIAISID